ncbi:MAG: copper chaperone PCu(A)C [Actinomycetota bacterium]|nr:copper chaperone PCu(A)C [Actinomycetota bacterium]
MTSAIVLVALVMTGCASANASSSIAVASAYVPVPTTPGTTVAYLDIRNNGKADRLISAQTSVGGTVQFRVPAGRRTGGLAMHTVAGITIPAESMTLFNPDTDHLLITGAGQMQDGKDIMLRLTFANAGTVTVIALVTDPQSGGSSYFLN